MSLTINQLLDAIYAAGDAAKGYAQHDAERESALADANRKIEDLQQHVKQLEIEIADLEHQLDYGCKTTCGAAGEGMNV